MRIDRSIDPPPHAGEIEILITFPQPGAGPTFRKLFTDRLDGEPHVRSTDPERRIRRIRRTQSAYYRGSDLVYAARMRRASQLRLGSS